MDVSHVQVEIRNAYKIYVGIQMTRDIRNIQGKKIGNIYTQVSKLS